MIPEVSASRAIAAIEPLEPIRAPVLAPAGPESSGAAFQSMLDSAIQMVAQSQESAAADVKAVLEGKKGEIHSAILSTQRAELQFQYFLQLRNKVVNAYQEIMRVQV